MEREAKMEESEGRKGGRQEWRTEGRDERIGKERGKGGREARMED